MAALAGCQSEPAPRPAPPTSIDVVVGGKVMASVVPGHPCRAKVAGVELLVGGPPLLSEQGSARWTGQTQGNGTTLFLNDRAVARIHANQLFDEQGIPKLRVMEDGTIVSGAGKVLRTATARTQPAPPRVEIRDAQGRKADDVVVTNTGDRVLAAFLSANEIEAELRALVACHLLLGPEVVTP
jgi:hypothetical protein